MRPAVAISVSKREKSRSEKKLVFDNRRADVFVEDINPIIGTTAEFSVGKRLKKNLRNIFAGYVGEGYEFSKALVTVQLFATKGDHVSR